MLSSRVGANRDGRNYVTGASQSVGRRRESPSTSAAPPEFTYIVTSTTLRFHGAGAGVTVSSRVGAVFERREREQKRSGGEGGGSANILVRGIKCSVAFACSFLLRNHWQLLQHLDRRSQAEQSKIAGIGELLVRLVWKKMPVVEDLL